MLRSSQVSQNLLVGSAQDQQPKYLSIFLQHQEPQSQRQCPCLGYMNVSLTTFTHPSGGRYYPRTMTRTHACACDLSRAWRVEKRGNKSEHIQGTQAVHLGWNQGGKGSEGESDLTRTTLYLNTRKRCGAFFPIIIFFLNYRWFPPFPCKSSAND